MADKKNESDTLNDDAESKGSMSGERSSNNSSNNIDSNSKEWSRGQVLEAVLNIQMDFDVSKATWDKNKEDLLKKIGSGEAGTDEVNSEAQIAQIKEEKQYKELLLHWRGLQEDFKDLDHGFELVQDTLKQGKLYYETTTKKTSQDLIDRNDEIEKQGEHMEKILEKGDKIEKTQEGMNKCMNSGTKFFDRIYCLLFLLCLVMTLTVLLVLRLIQKFDPDAFKEITSGAYNSTIGELQKQVTNSSSRLLR